MTARRMGGAAMMVMMALGPARAGEAAMPSQNRWHTCADGSFSMAGTAGCVRLTGQVAAESTLRLGASSSPQTARSSLFHQRAIGRVAADVRIPTELGPVRIYTQLRAGTAPAPDALRR